MNAKCKSLLLDALFWNVGGHIYHFHIEFPLSLDDQRSISLYCINGYSKKKTKKMTMTLQFFSVLFQTSWHHYLPKEMVVSWCVMLQVHSFIIFCKTLSEFWDFQFYALISLLFFLFFCFWLILQLLLKVIIKRELSDWDLRSLHFEMIFFWDCLKSFSGQFSSWRLFPHYKHSFIDNFKSFMALMV